MDNITTMDNMLGVDVSKDNLVCALLESQTRKLLWSGSVPNTAKGIAQLLGHAPTPAAFVVEPTGRYSDLVVRGARAGGRTVLLAPPRRAKAFLASIQSRAKTDPLDGRGLALFALSQPLRAFPIKSPVVEQIEQLLSARKGLSLSLTRLEMQRRELPHAASVLEPAIAFLKASRATVDKQIAALTKSAPELSAAKSLQSVPGIGPVVAASVAARLASRRFEHPDSFVAYVGLDISVRQSGKHSGQAGLTRQGDAELRRLLYLAAQANLRCKDPSNPFQLLYARERAKGLSSTAALCVVARKLAKLCWSLHRHQSVYDPSRVFEQGKRSPKPEQRGTEVHDETKEQAIQ